MKFEDKTGRRIPRRDFLLVLAGAASGIGPAAARQQELRILKSGDPDRLRLDFNANREKVRLLAVLSPT